MTAMSASGGKSQGQLDYEADVARKPRYSDRTPRKTWDELPEYARWSWEHEPHDRNTQVAEPLRSIINSFSVGIVR